MNVTHSEVHPSASLIRLKTYDDADAAPIFRSHVCDDRDDVELVVIGGDAGVIEDARDSLHRLARRWDLERRGSELCKINTADGPVPVSPETLLLAGLLEDHGIALSVDFTTGTVRRDSAEPIDPAGIPAALATDLVAAEALEAGADGVAVAVGNIVRVAGVGPYRAGWQVEAWLGSDGWRPLTLREGAVAAVRAGARTAIAVDTQAWRAQRALTALLAGDEPEPQVGALVVGGEQPAWRTAAWDQYISA
ncbi:FAD:protein FMN transferase [Fodinicola feengrottensis]|uniref:DUF2064 domain-containing protein n=1 Tax=Fodinicola feengrottensis TaxID=435914 RepID=A0ABN2HA31_9ACTN|nr:FAD:protein FMN transferase [Fodinicola feengrottensis]